MRRLTGKTLKHANNALLRLRISRVSRESNSTAELTLMWMNVALYSTDGGARSNLRCSTILRYSFKSGSWRHFIVHDQKSSYRTPLVWSNYELFVNKLVPKLNNDQWIIGMWRDLVPRDPMCFVRSDWSRENMTYPCKTFCSVYIRAALIVKTLRSCFKHPRDIFPEWQRDTIK